MLFKFIITSKENKCREHFILHVNEQTRIYMLSLRRKKKEFICCGPLTQEYPQT